MLPELAEILSAHRARLDAAAVEHPDLTKKGYMFPSSVGTLRTPNTLDRAWKSCLDKAKITKRFTVHGLRYTFTDLVRLANVDAVVRRALTGHVTEEMQRHYSTVGLDEKRAAIRGVLRLVPPAPTTEPASTTGSGVSGGVSEVVLKISSREKSEGRCNLPAFFSNLRAGYAIRTRDSQLGKLTLYH